MGDKSILTAFLKVFTSDTGLLIIWRLEEKWIKAYKHITSFQRSSTHINLLRRSTWKKHLDLEARAAFSLQDR